MTHSFPPRRSADLAIALSTVDGKTQWQTASTVETSSLFGAATPAIAFDTVVVGFSSGELMAMRIENSRPVWQDTLARTGIATRSEEHTSELQSLMRLSYAVFCLKQKKETPT